MTALRSSGDVSLLACSYLLTHLLLFGRVSLDVLAQGAGVGVALGAAGDLAGVGLLGTGTKGQCHTPLPAPASTGSAAGWAHTVPSLSCPLSLLGPCLLCFL